MELYVDDRRTDVQTPADARFRDVLEAVKVLTGTLGRMIVGITCDGIDVTGAGFAATLEQPAAHFARVDMHTADPAELVSQALSTAGELLDASEAALGQVVDQLALGKAGLALPRLAECCQAWLQVHEGICNAMIMRNLDLEALEVGGKRLGVVLAEPLEKLKQLKDAVQSGDHVLLSDILNYEFPSAMNTWRALIDAVGASAAAETIPPPAAG